MAVSPDGRNVYVTHFFNQSISVFSRNPATGALTQLAGTLGCVSENGEGVFGDAARRASADGALLGQIDGIVVSPDGENVYVGSFSNAVLAFSRSQVNGAITQLSAPDGCVSDTGDGGICEDGVALNGSRSIAIAPDGNHVYAMSQGSDALVAFSRTTSGGALDQLGGTGACVSEDGSGGACVDGTTLVNPQAITVSPDNANVYAGMAGANSGGNELPGRSLAAFSRNTTSGVVTQLPGTAGCTTASGPSDPDDPATAGDCATARALDSPAAALLAVAGNIYASDFDRESIPAFARAAAGALTQLAGTAGCVSASGRGEPGDPGTAGQCGVARGVDDGGLAASPDGRFVYAAHGDTIVALARTGGGGLTQLAGTDGCVTLTGAGGCSAARAVSGADTVAVSPDGENAYVAAGDGVAVFAREAAAPDTTPPSGTDGTTGEDEDAEEDEDTTDEPAADEAGTSAGGGGGDGGRLPFTGFDVLLLVILGLPLVLTGIVARASLHDHPPPS